MLNPEYLNKVENTYKDNSQSILEIPELTYFDGEQYDIYDSKDYARFIADIERVVRTSYEYRKFIAELRYNEGMNVCSILENVTNVDSNKIKIEIHHYPLCLHDVVSTIVKKRLHMKESIDIFDCANEVMWVHYCGFVGLLPLSATCHDLYHNGYIFLPLNIVRGNFDAFINDYYNFVDPDLLDALDTARRMTDDVIANGNDLSIFNLHATYIKYKNFIPYNSIPDGRAIIKDRIDEIKQTKKQLYTLVNKKPT